MPFGTTRMALEIIILSKIKYETEKDKANII